MTLPRPKDLPRASDFPSHKPRKLCPPGRPVGPLSQNLRPLAPLIRPGAERRPWKRKFRVAHLGCLDLSERRRVDAPNGTLGRVAVGGWWLVGASSLSNASRGGESRPERDAEGRGSERMVGPEYTRVVMFIKIIHSFCRIVRIHSLKHRIQRRVFQLDAQEAAHRPLHRTASSTQLLCPSAVFVVVVVVVAASTPPRSLLHLCFSPSP